MATTTRLGVTVPRDVYHKVRDDLKLNKGVWAEALRRGIRLIIAEKEGNSIINFDGLGFAVHPTVALKFNNLTKQIDQLKSENQQLQKELQQTRKIVFKLQKLIESKNVNEENIKTPSVPDLLNF